MTEASALERRVVDPPLDEVLAFRAECAEENARILLRCICIFNPIYVGWVTFDWFLAPQHLGLLFALRVAAATINLLPLPLLLRPPPHLRTTRAFWLWFVVWGAFVAPMLSVSGPSFLPYVLGLCVVIIGVGTVPLWPAWAAATCSAAILAPVGACLAILPPSVPRRELIGAGFFIVTVAIIAVVTAHFRFTLTRREFQARRALHREQEVTARLRDAERARATELATAFARLQELDRFKSQFFANITHELKTPLALILSPLDLFLHGDLGGVSDQQRSTLESMLRNGLRLLRLIGDLLDLARLEDSRLQLHVAEHDLVAFVRGLVDQVAPLAQRKQIEMRFVCAASTAPIWCDLERLERVVMNLVSNATKFTPAGGHVTVTLTEREAAVELTVSDDGPGFPADQAERVFERFYQVDMAGTRRYGGAGIGLALAREIVELHGGRIWATSAPGAGASFAVELRRGRDHLDPRMLARDDAEVEQELGPHSMDWSVQLTTRSDYRLLDVDEATERRVVERDPDETDRAHTVLVVEDTPAVVRIVHQTLRQYFRVIAAPDGRKGLELARRERPDLVITDLMMPEVDGLELTRQLRTDPATRHLPIIMLTARGGLEDRLKGLEGGVNAYLAKPFAARELLARVRSLLDLQQTTADILLTQRMDSLQLVTAGLAHEINNPLNYIKGALGCIRRDSGEIVALLDATRGRQLTDAERGQLARLDERIGKMLLTAEAGVARILGTVDLMRRYSREGFARIPAPHDVFAAARLIIDIVRPAIGKPVTVDCAFDGDGRIRCVPEEFNQVISNLVQNAIEAAPDENGRVMVHGWTADGRVWLSVKDNGPGISKEQQARLFTPFHTTKSPGQGMGLGLSICWQVVHTLGGTIAVTGHAGHGAEFLVQVPALEREARPPAGGPRAS